MLTPQQIVELFGMERLEKEGGYFVETYRARETVPAPALPSRYDSERCLCTAILYLLTSDNFSAMHRLRSDEVFHFYLGDAVTMLMLHPDGRTDTLTLGHDLAAGQRLQVTVPAGSWQGCFVAEGGRFALLGTTVSPGFEIDDFELADRKNLLAAYPGAADLIVRLTR